jgi:hypothetical protein
MRIELVAAPAKREGAERRFRRLFDSAPEAALLARVLGDHRPPAGQPGADTLLTIPPQPRLRRASVLVALIMTLRGLYLT